ncbi:MAG: N-acetyl-alpha-D-glucosaminyl L-malate synthase BshA [Bacteriovoracaceae bacterium]|nr:N-acetyl-alpha-D-glucosaminyl L-malate synthase BshA [Bacteroidota bacterium]
MKIGITCYPTYGGSGVLATELGKALAMRGHQIHFISYAMPMRLTGGFDNNIFYHEVEMTSYPVFEFPLYTPALASKMVEVANFEGLDLLHVHYAIPHATSAYLAKKMIQNENFRVTTTLHGTDITLVGLEPSFLSVMKFSIEKSDGVTAVSRYLREKTLTNYNIQKEIDVIPNFVDLIEYRHVDDSCVRKKFSLEDKRIIVHVSNFRPVKRVQDVIRIFDIVHKKIPSVLILVGDGPERSNCELLVRELGLQNVVKFLGKQIELTEILSAADLFLMPSQQESFGLSALEAMACEVPVISSSVGGLPELIVHNQTGYIAEIGDIERMAKYAIELLTNETKRMLFAKEGRKRAEQMFSLEKIVTEYETHYQKVMNSPKVE